MTPRRILETALYVRDVEEAEAFYLRVLRLKSLVKDPARHVFFRCGDGMLLLFNAKTTRTEMTEVNGVPIPLHGTQGAGHMAFAMREEEYDAWVNQLQTEGVPIDAEVVWPQGGRSIYFRDPSGNILELATPALWGMTE
jgi:catechol 2,3-dioxygenase-like lactoylglutathione lyase family enzyme